MIKYKYSKLARKILPILTWDNLIEMQRLHNGVTGKTTAHCLSIISQAMLTPDTKINLIGHTGQTSQQLLGCGGLVHTLEKLIEKLELDFFELSKKHLTLTYKPYGYVTKDWVVVE